MTNDNQRGEDGREIALEARVSKEDRLSSPSVSRNRDAIRDVFLEQMPSHGLILEIGSGTGEHAAHILKAAPDLSWQPSDPDEASRRSVDAWAVFDGLSDRMEAALPLDVTAHQWWHAFNKPVAGIVSINMIHIAPFAAAEGLIAGAGALLKTHGKLFLYGPFMRDGKTAPSNHDFDRSLKSRDPGWGVRDLDNQIVPLAAQHGLTLETVVEMPANNLSVVFSRQ